MESSGIFAAGQEPRRIEPTWNAGLIIASVAVSLLGAFTSTQLMCQARVSRAMIAIVVWTMLASLTFGFCSIWSLHFVAMLACELDLAIGLNVPLTLLSAFLAVVFTFLALATDLIHERYRKQKRGKKRSKRKEGQESNSRLEPYTNRIHERESTELLFARQEEEDEEAVESPPERPPLSKRPTQVRRLTNGHPPEFGPSPVSPYTDNPESRLEPLPESGFTLPSPVQHPQDQETFGRLSIDSDRDTDSCLTSNASDSRRSSGQSGTDSDTAFSGLGQFVSIRTFRQPQFVSENVFKTTALMLWHGLTTRNILKGFLWSLAITLMHYLGIASMKFDGYFVLQPVLVVLSAIISWVVCTVGCVLMSSMETNLSQQLLFSAVASCGVAAMHYTGMAATSFYSMLPPSDVRGYPPSLPIAIASIAIATCLAANGLLAQSATIARNKLAEIVRTRRKLWAAIAQKENAEAAALARSEFIASASHEIRTPLHQLQGYSDLMARCPLPEDARLLLFAIQDATKTLSLITNNVLDWSRLEKGEAVTRPTSLNIRSVCDSIVTLLPRRDDDMDVELIVIVAPAVPKYVYIDETYLQRIMMNLVSNALKFTTSGYIFLLLDLVDGNLVVTVQDTGVGIPDSFLPHLFEPFKQAQTRGAERGTGLGLSIVKQLIQKLQGDIEVESKHRDAKDVGPMKCGSKFIVRIPISISETTEDTNEGQAVSGALQKLALFDTPQRRNSEGIPQRRTTDGLAEAWAKLGVEVITVKELPDSTEGFKYVWVDLKCIKYNTELRQQLTERTDLTVLIPYDTENALYSLLGLSPPINFVPLKRPFVFHHIMEAIDNAGRRPDRSELAGRTVRFASEVDVLSNGGSIYGSEAAPEPLSAISSQPTSPELTTSDHFENKPINVLLVEDNKINQKLGAKMLKTLGYDVVLADDGQEAIDIITQPEHDTNIDMILMDQSMPRKDGLTATKEIRELEESGVLIGATRWRDCPKRRNRRPIIAVTAVVGPAHEAMCKTVGTDAFLPKPLSLKRLRETLELFSG